MKSVVWLPRRFEFTKKIDFPTIRYQNVQYFNIRHSQKPKLVFFLKLAVKNFFWPLSFPFCRLFYCRYLLSFLFFLAAIKRF